MSAIEAIVGVVLAAVFAGPVWAIDATCPQVVASKHSVEWSYAEELAIELPKGTPNYRKDSDYESAEFFDTPRGVAKIAYIGDSLSDWAEDLREMCRAAVDGYPVIIYELRFHDQPELGAVFNNSPLHPNLLVSVPAGRNSDERNEALAMLLSIRFINNPRKLKLVRIDRGGDRTKAIFLNELGKEFSAGVGEPVTSGVGLGRGLVRSINGSEVEVQEYAGARYNKYVFKIDR